MMFQLEFKDFKESFEKICRANIEKHLKEDTKYNKKLAQEWVNNIIKDTIHEIHESKEFEGYKILISATLIQAGGCCTNFSSKCVYNPMCDGNLIVQWENLTIRFFMCLYAVV